jgi:phasin family protein
MARKQVETPPPAPDAQIQSTTDTVAAAAIASGEEARSATEASPESAVPESAVPETAVPETAVPETAVTETAVTETAAAETAVTETAAAETAAAETAAAETAAAETAAAETAAAEAAAAETVISEPAVPQAGSGFSAGPAEDRTAKAGGGVKSSKAGPVVGPNTGAVRAPADIPTNIRTGVNSVAKTVEDIFAFGQGNLDAFVKSSQIWAAGVQDISKAVAATAQAQLDHTFATVKALAAIKSVKEVVDLQTNLARTSVEKVVAETGKLTDASVKLTEQTWAPIAERVTLAVEKFGRAA